jgi:Fe-S-cluster-containing hydrogenase component 2
LDELLIEKEKKQAKFVINYCKKQKLEEVNEITKTDKKKQNVNNKSKSRDKSHIKYPSTYSINNVNPAAKHYWTY